MIRIETLPHTFEPPSETFEKIALPMTAEERTRVRRRVAAPDGQELALALPTGTRLWPGQILYSTRGKVYVVEAAEEDVLVIHPKDAHEAAFAGHLIGNMHRDIDLDGEGVAVLYDEVLEERLLRAGFELTRERRPFRGSPNGEHVH